MFDKDRSGSTFASPLPPVDAAAVPAGPAVVPLERLEAQICELAGHLAAATCRSLVLLADFDARRGWASWEMSSRADQEQAQEDLFRPKSWGADPAARGRVTIYEPEDCDERWRQHLERTPRHTGPTLIPIQV